MNEVKAENLAKVMQVGTGSWSWNSGLFSGWGWHGVLPETLLHCLNHQIMENHLTVTRQVRYEKDTLPEASRSYLLVCRPNLEIARKNRNPYLWQRQGSGGQPIMMEIGTPRGTGLICFSSYLFLTNVIYESQFFCPIMEWSYQFRVLTQ